MQSFYYKTPITCGTIDGVLTKHFFVIYILLIFIYKCLCCACTYAGSYRIEQNRIGFYCHCLCTAKLWINYYKLLQVSCKQVKVVVYLVINVSYTALQ